VAYAITWLSELLARPSFNVKIGGTRYTELRCYLPYIIHDTDLDGTQILVNREYKPVGSATPRFGPLANYEEHVNLHVRLSPQQIQSVVSPPHMRGLYGDENPPWRKKSDAKAYMERLKRLHAIL
jgi:hypothetical protein